MSNSAELSDLEQWRRRLRQRLAMVGSSERPNVLRQAIETARPLVQSGKAQRAQVIDIAVTCAREHNVRSIKPSGAGFFRNLTDGPEAA